MNRLVMTLLLATLWTSIATAQGPIQAYVGARLIPIDGPEIPNGTMLVQDGKILAIGPKDDIQIPPRAEFLDYTGTVIMPGLICTHSHIGGIGGADSSSPMQPDVRIYDSINVRDSGFRRAVAGGLTTLNIMPGSGHLLSGQTVYVKLRGAEGEARTIDDLFILDEDGEIMGGIKMANGTNPMRSAPFPGTRGKAAAIVRDRFIQAQEYQEKIKRAAGDPSKMPKRDIGLEAVVKVLEGKWVVHHHTHRHDDIMTVIRLSKEFGFRVVLHHVSEAWKVADEIAAAGVGCSAILIDAPGGKLEAVGLALETGAALEKAGVLTAFHTDDYITDSRLFLRMAALGVRGGMSREGALKAVTLAGAIMLDLDHRIGSLTPGKDADFVVLSGDPLSVYTRVLMTYVEGKRVFDIRNEKDKLYAVGGYGAGHDQSPYFCCFSHLMEMGGAQ
ncbi:MAG TPA: amidohydrolase family protein [Phycisphaerales bacterium]|nr:amidohydrolase family protein [Phycisphaerales bacterium]